MFLVFFSLVSYAQVDSTTLPAIGSGDSIVPRINYDSLRLAEARKNISMAQEILRDNPFYRVENEKLKLEIEPRKQERGEEMFYLLVILILYFATIRIIFGKYLANVVTLFFKVTMRQQQIREQLLQTPLASLMLNILFVISSGLYMAFLSRYYQFAENYSFRLLIIYSIIFVGLIYLGKFLFLKITGWLFGVQKATDMYIFIVFMVNKMLGIFLLPFLVLLAFPHPAMHHGVVLLSIVLVVFLFAYRFFISFKPVRSEVKINRFHFFLYLCAFEIAPLVLIYKVLLNFVERGT